MCKIYPLSGHGHHHMIKVFILGFSNLATFKESCSLSLLAALLCGICAFMTCTLRLFHSMESKLHATARVLKVTVVKYTMYQITSGVYTAAYVCCKRIGNIWLMRSRTLTFHGCHIRRWVCNSPGLSRESPDKRSWSCMERYCTALHFNDTHKYPHFLLSCLNNPTLTK